MQNLMYEIPDVLASGFSGTLAEAELRRRAACMSRLHQLPFTLEEWHPGRLRAKLRKAMGVPTHREPPAGLEITRTLPMDGYTILCVSWLSRPGVRVTGNIYRPDGKGPFPAVINMHGHWAQGRLAERVQQRGHILAKSGYVCLCLDTFGQGERCPEHGHFTGHGGVLGGAPFFFGESLMGLQLADNMSGVDLLCTLPYVDSSRIGACGASGGGNQTMWLTALDTRIKAAIPVVSVGSFESYILSPNCVCECLPGGLTLTEEAGVLALAAPRALLVVNGAFDINPAFQATQARRSVDEARRIFRAYGVPENIRHEVMEERHGFSQTAQRLMLGWFARHLKGTGDGGPADALPAYNVLSEQELMVYEAGKRPADVVTLPEYVRQKETWWKKHAHFSRRTLERILNLEPVKIRRGSRFASRSGWERAAVEASDGRLTPLLFKAPAKGAKCVIIGTPYPKSFLASSPMLADILKKGRGVLIVDLWGGGENDLRPDPSCRDRFCNRSLMWMGSCQQGLWVEDYRLAEAWLKKRLPAADIAAAGCFESTLTAALYGALREERTELFLQDAPVSLTDPTVMATFGQALLVPNLLTCADFDVLRREAGGAVHFY